jgi:DNA mismatch repair protein MutS2
MRAKTLDDLGWPQLLDHLAGRCHTARGATAARALEPCADVAGARRRIADIAEARLLRELEEPMPFAGIHDIDDLLGRVEKSGELVGSELLAIGETVAGCARLKRHLVARAAQAPGLAGRVAAVLELAHVSGPILDAFEPGGGGRLADHASAALGGMRRKVADLHDQLAHRAKDLLDDPGIAPYLQDRFYTQRDDRYVVPLRADARSRVKGIVHGTSQSGQTVFVEPDAVVDLNNRLKIAESDVAEEERRILAELTSYVREEVAAVRAAVAAAEELDVIDAAARLADALGAAAPAIGERGELSLRRARHPLMLLAPRECVANDLELAGSATLVISGPNAGGKTVALKTAGLAAVMARAGLHVCADPGSHVPWYDVVETDIGDEQSLERNLSTFSAHIMSLVRFLAEAGPTTLLLIDELCVGTDPDQGSALAQAVLEAIADRGAQAVVTTHYERLKAMATRDPRFVNASVGFDLERMAPTFRLHAGVPGSSGALLVARRLGLPAPILARTEALLGDRRAGIEELLTAVTEERRRLEAERAATDTARREAEQARREAEAAQRAARAREEQLRRGAHDAAVAALRRARDELDELRDRLKKAGDDGAVVAARERLAALAGNIAEHAPPAVATASGRPATATELVPGAAVLLPKLGGRGQVVGVGDKGRVMVQLGTLRTTVALEDVRLDDRPRAERRADLPRRRPAPAAPPTAAVATPRGHDAAADELAPARTADATCDVRGARVDEALAEVDRFLDDSLLASREVVFVIHGHGTGALKAAIRDHLDGHAAVSRWRAGQDKEGGDGVTVAWLEE